MTNQSAHIDFVIILKWLYHLFTQIKVRLHTHYLKHNATEGLSTHLGSAIGTSPIQLNSGLPLTQIHSDNHMFFLALRWQLILVRKALHHVAVMALLSYGR